MATPRFLAVLFIAALLLALSFPQGSVVIVEGRKVQVMRAAGHYGRRWRSPLGGGGATRLLQEEEGAGGMVSTVADYSEPKANTNPHGNVPATPEYPTSPPGH
ncbi:uncharacterized protein LOC104584676 [Brachypodium distachyon]|uniref:Uncharacterized protein n=1 Tax=Brachypodium distachyon TaxID=15368 RepID=I1IQ28_BRADI|nr:uncharacterized protein LOC104584676 [Brachypodium distachyon]KQJ90211.1 hypothetical protein BRADI_4g30120v3 [Brachypodium distachyon]|eukprot:XP_010238156.1 uncharacterized protein LOC104584676 [Brachypodium distachyon]